MLKREGNQGDGRYGQNNYRRCNALEMPEAGTRVDLGEARLLPGEVAVCTILLARRSVDIQ